MVDCLHCFGSEMREAPTVEKCSLHDKWVAMRRRGRRAEHNVPHAVDLLSPIVPTTPTFHTLPMMS